jgi:competence ComEA-like helix-hairpin-helix protein
MDEHQGSIAVGVAFLAVLGAIWVSVEVLGAMEPELESRLTAPCEQSIEVVEDGLSRLSCVTDPALTLCTGMTDGARVELASGRCEVRAGGMAALFRLRLGKPLDLNTVSASELTLIKGIGHKLSDAIVEQRQLQGGFRSVEELTRVHGIGEVKLRLLRSALVIQPAVQDAVHHETIKGREAQ